MRKVIVIQSYIILCPILLIFLPNISNAIDTITPTQAVRDGETTLVSSGERFELGFFSPGNSKNRYVGIWYKRITIQTVVWVANRDNPLTNSSGTLRIGDDGNLILTNTSAGSVVWSSNQSKADNLIAQLLDSGNLVIREENDENPENYLWQSFDYPTDTLLPDMKVGWNLRTGMNRILTSWKREDDPSTGDYSFRIDPHGFPEGFLWNRLDRQFRTGPWNGLTFSGIPQMKPNYIFNFNFTSNQEEVYYSFSLKNESLVSRLMVHHSGVIQRSTWLETNRAWNLLWYLPKDQCDNYRECGAYGICDINGSPMCKCVEGFEPKNPDNWYLRDGSGGCIRKSEFDCQNGSGFLRLRGMKLPDTSLSFADKSMTLKECEARCRKNCSCTAYANSDIPGGGTGCVIWTGDLMDLREFAQDGQDIYIRVAASELEEGGNSVSGSHSDKNKRVVVIVIVTVAVGVLLFGLSVCFIKKGKTMLSIWKGNTEERGTREKTQYPLLFDVVIPGTRNYSDENKDSLELTLFDLSTIAAATDHFSDANKVGQGGYGCVYKGKLVEGKEIAVKRLSNNSRQGTEEFKNEVMLIAKVQHRNLVRLLGCCIEMEEKMLIYEYMQNKSLDTIIFNRETSALLDWRKRFDIISGIARGLLYLHQDSRFRIIHRDLKASNILLDGELNPKISDFGMARIFGGDQIEENTERVVGTYGYMSPEYAMDGLFSVKSDVFSFGVLVLEIISGKKNKGFYCSDNQVNLLGHVWRLWREGSAVTLLDSSMADSCPTFEVLRCIQVGLLCVQERAEDRPTISSVILMLSSENAILPQPKKPGFCLGTIPIETESSSSKQESNSLNQVTVTMLEAR